MKTGKATSTYRGIPGKHEAETRDMRGRLFLLQHRLSIPSEGRDCGQSPNCEISAPSAGYASISCSTGACSTEAKFGAESSVSLVHGVKWVTTKRRADEDRRRPRSCPRNSGTLDRFGPDQKSVRP